MNSDSDSDSPSLQQRRPPSYYRRQDKRREKKKVGTPAKANNENYTETVADKAAVETPSFVAGPPRPAILYGKENNATNAQYSTVVVSGTCVQPSPNVSQSY